MEHFYKTLYAVIQKYYNIRADTSQFLIGGKQMERTRAPLGERRLVFVATALVLLFFLAGFVYLGVGAWRQYRNGIIDNQKGRCS